MLNIIGKKLVNKITGKGSNAVFLPNDETAVALSEHFMFMFFNDQAVNFVNAVKASIKPVNNQILFRSGGLEGTDFNGLMQILTRYLSDEKFYCSTDDFYAFDTEITDKSGGMTVRLFMDCENNCMVIDDALYSLIPSKAKPIIASKIHNLVLNLKSDELDFMGFILPIMTSGERKNELRKRYLAKMEEK